MIPRVIAVGLIAGFLSACSPADSVFAHSTPLVSSISEEPRQVNLPLDEKTITQDTHVLKPRADYEIKAKVISRTRYRFDDLADIAPVDVALAWGPAADNEVLDKLSFSQSGRWIRWRFSGSPPIAIDKLVQGIANVHMVTPRGPMFDFLLSLKKRECVWLKGKLVDVHLTDPIGTAHTSLTRSDQGGGACEIFLVEEARRVSCDD